MGKKAFENFGVIQTLETIHQKHRAWLKSYEGLNYGIAEESIHQFKWKLEPRIYKDVGWASEINLIKRKANRTRIEFDGDKEKARADLEAVQKKLIEMKVGFIRSTHNGKTDYLWVEFTRDLLDTECLAFLKWIAPEGSVIDEGFASSKRIFPIMFAIHWKYSYDRETPVLFHEGEQIDFDSLAIVINTPPRLKKSIDKNKYPVKEGGLVSKIVERINITDLAKEFGIDRCPTCGKDLSFDDSRGFFCCEDSRYNCDFKGGIVEFVKRCRNG